MPRPVLFGLFLGRQPTRTWRVYFVMVPRFGLVSLGGSSRGYAAPGLVGVGLWYSRVSPTAGDRLWIRKGRFCQ